MCGTMKKFEEYLQEGVVQKITPDNQRAKNLYLESERKFRNLQKMKKKLEIDDENANDYIEYCYNIIIFLIRAKMLEQGYSSSGQGAHEAEVSFEEKLGFSQQEIQETDQLRYFRNGILYYGKKFDQEYAKKIVRITEKMFHRIRPESHSN